MEKRKKEICLICDSDAKDGITCNSEEQHSLCLTRFGEDHLHHQLSIPQFALDHNRKIVCQFCLPKIIPFTSRQLAQLGDDIFDKYEKAVSDAAILSGYREAELRFRKSVEELPRDNLCKDSIDFRIHKHRLQIVENILTSHCPRKTCQAAILDFDGCFALTCSCCGCGICGWCLKDCGEDSHFHVKGCKFNLHPGSFGGTIAEFHETHRERKRLTLLDYLRTSVTDEGDKVALLEAIQKDLLDLGIDGRLQSPSSSNEQNKKNESFDHDGPVGMWNCRYCDRRNFSVDIQCRHCRKFCVVGIDAAPADRGGREDARANVGDIAAAAAASLGAPKRAVADILMLSAEEAKRSILFWSIAVLVFTYSVNAATGFIATPLRVYTHWIEAMMRWCVWRLLMFYPILHLESVFEGADSLFMSALFIDFVHSFIRTQLKSPLWGDVRPLGAVARACLSILSDIVLTEQWWASTLELILWLRIIGSVFYWVTFGLKKYLGGVGCLLSAIIFSNFFYYGGFVVSVAADGFVTTVDMWALAGNYSQAVASLRENQPKS